jgi:hypothetical protein
METPLQILERYRREVDMQLAARRRVRGRIKRLNWAFDRTREAAWDEPVWRPERARYAEHGVDESEVQRILQGATMQRRYYEDLLWVRPFARQEAARIAARTGEYEGRQPTDPRHRPGERWLRRPVKALARLFVSHGISVRQAQRSIYAALKLAGHGDVVSTHMIRRIAPNRQAIGTD